MNTTNDSGLTHPYQAEQGNGQSSNNEDTHEHNIDVATSAQMVTMRSFR